MKYLLIIFAVLVTFTSCKSLKTYVSHSSFNDKTKTEQVTDTSKVVISKSETDVDTTKTVDVDTEVVVIQTDTTTVDGKLLVFPKTITKTKTTKIYVSKGNTSTKTSSDIKATGTASTITKTDIEKKEDIATKRKFNNTSIERIIYLLIAVIIVGYVVIKKYFPSIFAKLYKHIM
jgi:hypothetical protein